MVGKKDSQVHLAPLTISQKQVGGGSGFELPLGVLRDMAEKAYGFAQNDYEGCKERVINGVALLLSFLAMVSGLSKWVVPFGNGFIGFFIYLLLKFFGHIAFAILELAVEYWWAVLGMAAIVLMVVFR